MSTARQLHGAASAAKRWHPDDPRVPELRREAEAQSIAERVEALIAQAPALNTDQVARIITALGVKR